MQKDARVAGVDAEIVLAPEDGNLSHWVGHVRGPVETPYEVGRGARSRPYFWAVETRAQVEQRDGGASGGTCTGWER
mgnify:CR=1 FL=1